MRRVLRNNSCLLCKAIKKAILYVPLFSTVIPFYKYHSIFSIDVEIKYLFTPIQISRQHTCTLPAWPTSQTPRLAKDFVYSMYFLACI